MSAKETYELVYDHVAKYGCEIETAPLDGGCRFRVVVICRKDATKSATGNGSSYLEAYRNLASKLKLGEEAPA